MIQKSLKELRIGVGKTNQVKKHDTIRDDVFNAMKKEIDSNKDNEATFEDWKSWESANNKQLGRLIYLKLNALKLLDKVGPLLEEYHKLFNEQSSVKKESICSGHFLAAPKTLMEVNVEAWDDCVK